MKFILTTLCIGAAMGLVAGLIGVGGGIIAIPAMIYFLKMDPRVAMGTSLAIIVPVAIAGSLKQHQQGNVDLACFLWIGLAGIAFSVLGAWLSAKIPSFWLQRVFAVFIICVGVKMLMK